MPYIIGSLIFLLLGLALMTGKALPESSRRVISRGASAGIGVISILIALILFLSVSFVYIPKDQTGHLNKIYGTESLPDGAIIAANGEKGPQAEILKPGFNFRFLLRFFYDIDPKPVIIINEGEMGLLLARDGKRIPENQFFADAWPLGSEDDMLDAKHFLTEGQGQKGPQLYVLKPGIHRLNTYLFDVEKAPVIDVQTGEVAVIRSNVKTINECPSAVETAAGEANGNLATPLVPNGCVGIWETPLQQGRYYLNPKAYVDTRMPSRAQVWVYKGGYNKRQVDLKVNSDGSIVQDEKEPVWVDMPPGAADTAMSVRTEGWTVPIEARVVVQVHPKDAPRVVASVGTLEDVENKIMTPLLRDELRTIGGNDDRKVLDFINKRAEITDLVERVLVAEGQKAGVTVQEFRLGEAAFPPEVLLPKLRKQLAEELKNTYIQEKLAQQERISVEKTRAEADQQSQLVKAQIADEAAVYYKSQREKEGQGERLYLEQVSQGEAKRTAVLGQEFTADLKALEMSLAAAKENPEMVKVPYFLIQGGGSLENMGAIMAASNSGVLGTGSTLNNATLKGAPKE